MRRSSVLAIVIFVTSTAIAQTVWDDFDPDKLPLDVEIVRTQKEGDVEVQVLRYTSEMWNDKPIRVLGMYGRPQGEGKFPAILHFHGGGQTASPRDIAEMVQRGYACFSFDWTGPAKDRKEVTEWPADIKTHYEPDKTNKLYHAVIAGRRGITFLTQRPEVDADRIGEYGISWGGYCTWLLNGTDTRLKACVPVYGCGGVVAEGRPHERMREQLGDKIEDWMKNFEPLRYGPRQHAPVLYISGSNDFFGWPPVGREILLSCKVPTRQVFTPGINHGVGPEAAEAAYAWLAHYLKGGPALPESPTLKPAVGERGIPQAVLTVDREGEAEYVRVDYSLGSNLSPGRCWREVPAKKEGDLWIAALPVLNPLHEVQAIAQVKYKAGYRLSSVPVIFVPKELGATVASLEPTKEISIFGDGIGGWSPVFHSTQLYGARQRLELEKEGFNGQPCLKVIPLVTPFTQFTVTFWRPGDPQWNGGDSEAIALWIQGADKAVALTATVRHRQVEEKSYSCLVRLKPEKGWQQIIARRDQFKFKPNRPRKDQDAPEETLASWRDVQVIQIGGPVAEGQAVMIGPTVWLSTAP
ncbi:MAG: acetylxylan esterase [Planctomycetota bacterium]